MSKHKPQTWVVMRTPNDDDFSHEVEKVCAVYRDDCSDANASLIAAAPDLLEALQAVMAEHEDGYGLRCVDQVRAAIQRAKGEA